MIDAMKPTTRLASACALLMYLVTAIATAQHSPRRNHPPAHTMRSVVLVLSPNGVRYSIDGQPFVDYGSPQSRNLRLQVGPHRFRVVPNGLECLEIAWSQQIDARTEPLRIERTLTCR